LAKFKDPHAVALLISAMRKNYGLDEARALGEIGAASVEPLSEILSDPSVRGPGKYTVEFAVMGLGLTKDARAVAPLIKSLKDPDDHVRFEACKSLAAISDVAFNPLIRALKDKDPLIQEGAVASLVAIRDPAGLRALTVKAIARAEVLLIKMGTPGSEDLLIDALYKVGDKSMAQDFLNCGNAKLEAAARAWAASHAYSIVGGGGGNAAWGRR
jgi:HEAT repeat protein